MKIRIAFLLACALFGNVQAAPPNYDESKVGTYTLPDPLIANDGSPVTDAQTWQTKRRAELLELFRSQVFGRSPTPPKHLRFQLTDINARALGGLATRKQIAIYLGQEKDAPQIHLLLYVPNGAHKLAPVFLVMNFLGNHDISADPGITIRKVWKWNRREEREQFLRPAETTRGANADMQWPLRQILERGYALATVHRDEIEPDYPEGWKHGVRGSFLKGRGRTEFADDDWGAIGAWAWGLSRALDYLQTDRDIDARRVVIMGHSRLGKAALWAGAQDERFAIVISK
jgi:hypothetical protein